MIAALAVYLGGVAGLAKHLPRVLHRAAGRRREAGHRTLSGLQRSHAHRTDRDVAGEPLAALTRLTCLPAGRTERRDDERMDVTEVLLPGVGLRYEFTNYEGDRVGIVAGRTRYFELVVYPGGDPDEARPVVRLNSEEADTVAEILGAPRIAERFADLTKEVPGLLSGQVDVRAGSPYVDQPLGRTRARTRTGASIVAIVRGEDVIASPAPDRVLRAGDVLVVIGTRDGIAGVEQIVQG